MALAIASSVSFDISVMGAGLLASLINRLSAPDMVVPQSFDSFSSAARFVSSRLKRNRCGLARISTSRFDNSI